MNNYKVDIDNLCENTSHIQIINRIPFGSTVLDVGCACGDLGVYLSKNKNCEMYGLEYNKESINIAKKTFSYREIEEIDLNRFEKLQGILNRKYDIIVFGDILEHLLNPKDTIKKILHYLSANGKIIISIPNICHISIIRQLLNNNFHYMDYGILDKTHVRFFTFKSMAEIISDLGLEIISSSKIIYGKSGLHSQKYFTTEYDDILYLQNMNPHINVLQYVFDAAPRKFKYSKLLDINISNLNKFSPDELDLISTAKGNDNSINYYNSNMEYNMLTNKIKIKLKKHLHPKILNILKKVYRISKYSNKFRNSFRSKKTYKKYVTQIFLNEKKIGYSSSFVDITSQSYIPNSDCPKAIAFYLPQFYPFEENDRWWGRGFTEWTNVTKAVPQFLGHYQPQLPIDLGFYDLRLPDVMSRQIELAKLYGIYGFCFHYYWFSGKRLMDKPIFNFLQNKDYNINFCLCWANESWSRRWDGSENELLLGQNLQASDDFKFIDDISPFLMDDRYIKINGKPLVIIYRPHLWKKSRVLLLTDNFRKQIKKYGINDLYLVFALSHDFNEIPTEWGFDAAVEFPPHLCFQTRKVKKAKIINTQFDGAIYDMGDLVNCKKHEKAKGYTIFPTVFPGWDNTPRKNHSSCIFYNSSPEVYKMWLNLALDYSYRHNSPEEHFVFINAWNEWGEGAHLEPDRKYGYAYLASTGEALTNFSKNISRSK